VPDVAHLRHSAPAVPGYCWRASDTSPRVAVLRTMGGSKSELLALLNGHKS
jgi:hypothetical protein